jgi:hypothetical protein
LRAKSSIARFADPMKYLLSTIIAFSCDGSS